MTNNGGIFEIERTIGLSAKIPIIFAIIFAIDTYHVTNCFNRLMNFKDEVIVKIFDAIKLIVDV